MSCFSAKRLVSLILILVALLGARRSGIPLILTHSDHLSASKRAGEYLLKGKVSFRHDSARFFTGRARWDTRNDKVICQSGFKLIDPSGELKAKRGIYDRRKKVSAAHGNVQMKDSSGRERLYGEHLTYYRDSGLVILEGKPRLMHVDMDSVDKKGKIHKGDTTWITAKRMLYFQHDSIAQAYGEVKLTRDSLKVTCDTGYFYLGAGRFELHGKPKASVEDYKVKGKKMVINLKNRQLESILVQEEATGVHIALERNKDTSYSEIKGDTLFARFDAKKIAAIMADSNAEALFYENGQKEFINSAKGDHIQLDFAEGRPHSGLVSGEAQTLYHYVDRGQLNGRNESRGDTVEMGFRSGKIDQIAIKGSVTGGGPATGIYYGEKAVKLDKPKREDRKEKRDKKDRADKVESVDKAIRADSTDRVDKMESANTADKGPK